MGISRRHFVKGSSAAILAFSAPSLSFASNRFNSLVDKKMVLSAIKRRFPFVNVHDSEVGRFVEAFLARKTYHQAVPGAQLTELINVENPQLSVDFLAGREFILNTNILAHKEANFSGIVYLSAEDIEEERTTWDKLGYSIG